MSRIEAVDYVCRIGTTPYATLAEAVTAANASTSDVTIEMLVQSYNMTASIPIGNTGGHTITLTTASSVGTNCVINRQFNGGNLFTLSKGGLKLTNITLDGRWQVASGSTSYYGANGSIIYASGGSTLTMDSGSTICNARNDLTYYDHGGAVLLTGTGTSFYMKDGASGTGCMSGFYGGFLYQESNTTFVATGGSLTNNSIYIAGGSGGAIMQAPAGSNIVTELGGDFQGTGNSCGANGTFVHGGGISNCVIRIKDQAVIEGNRKSSAQGSYDGSAVFQYSSTIEIQGQPVVKGNFQNDGTTEKNIFAPTNSNLKITGDLTGDAVVGIWNTSNYTQGTQFGITTATQASSVSGLYHLYNDRNTGLYGMAGTNNAVIWGTGTCQIIRTVNGTPTLVGIYATLADACTAAQTGDAIEVFKSHVSTAAVLASGKTGVTIKTAPTETPTVSNSRTFLPASGENTTATVSRGTSDTTSTLLTVSGEATVSNLILDGKSVASDNPLISVSQGGALTLRNSVTVKNGTGTTANGSVGTIGGIDVSGTLNSGATITSCQGKLAGAIVCESTGKVNLTDGTNITGNSATLPNPAYTPGAVVIMSQTGLTVTGKVIVKDNTNASGNAANVGLVNPTGTIGVIGGLSPGSYIGVNVLEISTDKEHVSGHDFALGYASDGQTPSSATATAAVGYFHDDISPNLAIAANGTTAGDVTHESKIYFDDGHIIVTKTATGTYADKTKTFTISASYTTAGGTVVTRTCDIADGGSQTFSIPVGTAYTVTETAAAGYTGSVTATAPAGGTETPVKNGDGITVTGTKAVGNTTLAYTNNKIDIPVTGVATGSDSSAWVLIGIGSASILSALGIKWKYRQHKKSVSK